MHRDRARRGARGKGVPEKCNKGDFYGRMSL